MEKEQNEKLGFGIVAISIIYIVMQLITMFYSSMSLISYDYLIGELSSGGMDTTNITKASLIATLIISAIILASVVLILFKISWGIYLFYITILINIFSSVFANGFTWTTSVLLVLPFIYGYLIKRKTSVFGFKNNPLKNK